MLDFAILVADGEQFNTVKSILKTAYGYEDICQNTFKLPHANGTHIDILPFGDIAQDDIVVAGGQGLTTIRVNGFKEVAKAGLTTADIEQTHYRLATLPAIVLLKLIAYDDKPEQRPNDATDIANIFKHYFDLDMELFFDKHHDVLADIDEGRAIIGARVAGREMKPMLDLNDELQQRIARILDEHILRGADSHCVQALAKQLDGSINLAISTLEGLKQGLTEQLLLTIKQTVGNNLYPLPSPKN